MGKDGFSWFVGVVEDRNDPAKVGRVRVRVLGRHSESLTEVKTTDLPWAHVMHPVTDPSMQGLGHTPSFLTEGSWVVGFFRDTEAQQPVIMGSLPGIPSDVADPTKGFSDPRGIDVPQKPYASKKGPTYGPYPDERDSGHDVGESDTNRLARGVASESHKSMIDRRANRLSGDFDIPTATKPYLPTVSQQAVQETRGSWEEPNPKGIVADANPYISSAYPYNHVFESESGHITEVDDSPGAERMFRQHKTGTFEEIHPDGSVVTKIVRDDYEIVIGNQNIVIKGLNPDGTKSDVVQNITVEGSVRELIKGDYIQEIEGDFYQKIHKNHRVKVGASDPGGNREEEIIGNYGYNINKDVIGRIGGDTNINYEQSVTQIVGGSYLVSARGKVIPGSNGLGTGIFLTTNSDFTVSAVGNISQSTISGIMSMKSGGTLNMKSAAAMTVNSETTFTGISTGVGTLTFSGTGSEITAKNSGATNISLTTHIHSQGADSASNAQVNTNAPVS